MATIYYTGCTLDGFIATDDHSLDWLLSRDIDQEGPMAYAGFRERIGACVMGASTWQWILEHDDDPWGPMPTWVLTHRTFPDAPPSVRFDRDDVRRVHAEMSEAEKVTARYSLLMEQTAQTAGDFANTSGNLSVQGLPSCSSMLSTSR